VFIEFTLCLLARVSRVTRSTLTSALPYLPPSLYLAPVSFACNTTSLAAQPADSDTILLQTHRNDISKDTSVYLEHRYPSFRAAALPGTHSARPRPQHPELGATSPATQRQTRGAALRATAFQQRPCLTRDVKPITLPRPDRHPARAPQTPQIRSPSRKRNLLCGSHRAHTRTAQSTLSNQRFGLRYVLHMSLLLWTKTNVIFL
jgi:hypothetical protein